jgi:ArsR family transcriptional regulator
MSQICHCGSDLEEINQIKQTMPKDEKLFDLAEFFKVFGDSTRIKIIYALSRKEMCVCDIAELIDMSQSAISHQLRVLKNHKLVKFRKEGKSIYYTLDDQHVDQIFNQGMEHINHI